MINACWYCVTKCPGYFSLIGLEMQCTWMELCTALKIIIFQGSRGTRTEEHGQDGSEAETRRLETSAEQNELFDPIDMPETKDALSEIRAFTLTTPYEDIIWWQQNLMKYCHVPNVNLLVSWDLLTLAVMAGEPPETFLPPHHMEITYLIFFFYVLSHYFQ